ncbi:MAG: DsbC family protein [Deltaproteobacteria bacterium]|nr:DsbC family protein [Deltaproteobacteria bacterium]
MIIFPLIVFVCVVLLPVVSMAKENFSGDCSSCHTLSIKEAGELTSALNVTVKSVVLSPVNGLFEVRAERDGKEGLIFIDYGKKYLMQGVMVKIDDLKAGQTSKPPRQDVSKLLRLNSVILGNSNASKQLFVFSDPDCPFCRQMHDELRQLVADNDIAVYIKPYPVETHPGAYDKSRAILESNSVEMLDKAFAGEEVPTPKDPLSKAAVDDIIGLAKSLGIKGTPAFLLPNGNIEVGFRSAAALKKMIDAK